MLFAESDDGSASAAVMELGLYVVAMLWVVIDDSLLLQSFEDELIQIVLASKTLLARGI